MPASPPTRGSYRGKRAFDLALLIGLAPLAAVLGAVAAAAVWCEDRGPVLFRQERTGWDGQTFVIWKLRTMVAAAHATPVFPDATNITRVGRLLRRLSLDELPQLVNVARGEMSIVGPRPTLPYQVSRYDDRQRARLRVRPGLTGLAQVQGRNRIAWAERIELDLEYVRRQSMLLDLTILARSAAVVLAGGGVTGHPEDDPIARNEVGPDDVGAAEPAPASGRNR